MHIYGKKEDRHSTFRNNSESDAVHFWLRLTFRSGRGYEIYRGSHHVTGTYVNSNFRKLVAKIRIRGFSEPFSLSAGTFFLYLVTCATYDGTVVRYIAFRGPALTVIRLTTHYSRGLKHRNDNICITFK